MKIFASTSAPITELHTLYGVYDNVVLTKYGSLIGGVRLYGRDPDALLPNDHIGLSMIARNIYERLPANIIITQLYTHYDGFEWKPREREHPIAKLSVESAAQHINAQGLSNSDIVHFFELMPNEKLTQLNLLRLVKHLGSALFSDKSRAVIKAHFSHSEAIVVQYEALVEQKKRLLRTIEEITAKWDSVVNAESVNNQTLWAYSRFLASGNSDLLHDALDEPMPTDDWDKQLNRGDIDVVTIDGVDMLKLRDADTRYARVASVTHFGKQVMPGLWAFDDKAVMWQACNFSIMTRFKPLSKLQKSLLFQKKNNELERASMNVLDMVTNTQKTAMEKKALMKPAIATKYQELAEAETIEDRYGLFHSLLFVFDKTPQKVLAASGLLNTAVNHASMSVVWESPYLEEAFKMVQLGGGKSSLRDSLFTSTQVGAASLITKRVTGLAISPDIDNEESQMVLACVDNTPFHFNPTAGGRPLLLGVGPTGSGKTFAKEIFKGQFLKYTDSRSFSIDVDAGSEATAQLYGEDGGIFRIDDEVSHGFNAFVSCKGKHDTLFMEHYRKQLISMMRLNDDAQMQTLDKGDQHYLDNAISRVMAMPPDLQRLGTVIKHMPQELADKFQRWVYGSGDNEQDGIYAALFDEPVDAIGALSKRVAVFNLKGLKGNSHLYALAANEITFRVGRVFESEALLGIPKQLEVDEAHIPLAEPTFADFITTGSRTWRKWLARVLLWSQTPDEFIKLPCWAAVRDAVGTFVFTANPKLDDDQYEKAFKLSTGEINAIKNLIPHKEIYIVQPYIGVSKKVRIDVAPKHYVLATSKPSEVILRQQNIARYGFTAGIDKTIADLAKNKAVETAPRIAKMQSQRDLLYGENTK